MPHHVATRIDRLIMPLLFIESRPKIDITMGSGHISAFLASHASFQQCNLSLAMPFQLKVPQDIRRKSFSATRARSYCARAGHFASQAVSRRARGFRLGRRAKKAPPTMSFFQTPTTRPYPNPSI